MNLICAAHSWHSDGSFGNASLAKSMARDAKAAMDSASACLRASSCWEAVLSDDIFVTKTINLTFTDVDFSSKYDLSCCNEVWHGGLNLKKLN